MAKGLAQVLMATNRIDILDPALLRPGRIDRKIEFPNPNESSRADILRIHSRKMNLVRGIDLRKIADKMTGASGAELKVCPILLPLEYGKLSFTISVQDCGAEPVQGCVHLWEGHSKTQCSLMVGADDAWGMLQQREGARPAMPVADRARTS